jgi:hypothetical protein
MTDNSPIEDKLAKKEYGPAVGKLLGEYKGEQVLFITDTNHFRTLDIHAFAFAVAEAGRSKGINAVGLEMLLPSQQLVVDALARGEITRSEFLEFYEETVTHSHLSGREKNEFYTNIADAIQGGIKVYALGSYSGITHQVDLTHKLQSLYVDMELDYLKYRRDNHSGPDMGREDFYQSSSKRLIKEALLGRMAIATEKELSSMADFLTLRLSDDEKIAENIKRILPESGNMILVYGQTHSLHKKDIDSTLRKQGNSVMIVDPGLGNAERECTQNMPSEVCSQLPEFKRWMADIIRGSYDPDRYSIPDIKADSAEIKPIPKPNIIERILGINL